MEFMASISGFEGDAQNQGLQTLKKEERKVLLKEKSSLDSANETEPVALQVRTSTCTARLWIHRDQVIV